MARREIENYESSCKGEIGESRTSMSGSVAWSAATGISRSELLKRAPLVYEVPQESLENELEVEGKREDVREMWRRGRDMVREREKERRERIFIWTMFQGPQIFLSRKGVT